MGLERSNGTPVLTKSQQDQLLLLTKSKWRALQREMQRHYELGDCLKKDFTFLVALTSEQWQTIILKLERLRAKYDDQLREMRRTNKKRVDLTKRKEYMQQYMQKYRKRKDGQHGQSRHPESS